MRRAHLAEGGYADDDCDGTCDGRPDSHDGEAMPRDVGPGLEMFAWPGGECSPVCVPWAARSPWVASMMRSTSWANAGQPLGVLDSQPPAMADGVMAVKSEWGQVQAESIEKTRNRNGNR